MHELMSRVELATLQGTDAVEYDFVEAPSQMLEHW
jgi:Zn-dependent oligopeptidase